MSENTNINDTQAFTTKLVLPELIALFVVFLTFLNIPYLILMMFLPEEISYITLFSLQVILQGILVFFTWKISISITLKNKKLARDELSRLLFGMLTWTAIYCAINCFNNIETSLEAYKEYIENDFSIKLSETIMGSVYSDEYMREYQIEKQKAIQAEKEELTTYIIISSIGITVTALCATALQRKTLKKHVVCEEKEELLWNTPQCL
ncbi:MAG: hypothetical protein IJX99_01670 [Clostridia bacterium]|nr:hypothetical protein [Clostridia bacterium]